MKVILCLLATTLFLLTPSAFSASIEKALRLHNADRNIAAINILEGILNEDPSDKNHFNIGKTYLKMNMPHKAKRLFTTLVSKLNPRYGPKVAKIYENRGDYETALVFDPSPTNKARIARLYLDRATYFVKIEDYSHVHSYFRSAYLKDPSLGSTIEKMVNKAKRGKDYKAWSKLHRILSLASDIDDKILGDEVKAKADKATGVEREYLIEQLRYYWTKKQVASAFPPDYKTYQAGDTVKFILYKGMISDHFVRYEGATTIDIVSSVNVDQYEILPRNGKPIKVWDGDKIPDNLNDYRFRAVEDVVITLFIESYRNSMATIQ